MNLAHQKERFLYSSDLSNIHLVKSQYNCRKVENWKDDLTFKQTHQICYCATFGVRHRPVASHYVPWCLELEPKLVRCEEKTCYPL